MQKTRDLKVSALSTACLGTIIAEMLDVKKQIKIINFVFRIMGMGMYMQSEKHTQTTTAISVTQQVLTKPRITIFISSVPLKINPTRGGSFPWSFTLSFSSQTSLGVTGPGYSDSENFCQDKEFYNIITSKCEVFSCSSGYERVGNTCHKLKISNVITIKTQPSTDA